MTLSDQKKDYRGNIRDLVGDERLVARLTELGFVRGAFVEVRGRAPFGEPIFVAVRGTLIALRDSEAQCIRL